MDFERFFVLIFLCPALAYFIRFCIKEKRIDPIDFKFQFIFYWLFYGFAVPIDYVIGFEIIKPWAVVDYTQEKFFYSMLTAMLLFYTTLIGFLITYRKPIPINHYVKNQNVKLLTIPITLLVIIVVSYFLYNLDDILSLSRMERNIQGVNSSYRILKFFETVLTATGCIFILFNKNIKNVHILTFILILLGAAQGDRSSILVPAFAWLLRVKPTIKTRHFFILILSALFLLFVWKALYSFAIAYALGNDVSLNDMLKSFSFSIIEPVSSYNLTTWVLADWGLGDIYGGYTIFVLPYLRALPRFLFEFDVPTLAEQFMSLYLPHIAAKGGGRGFGIVAEFYLNFYYIGPFIFGIIWGLLAKYINNKHSLILSFIFLLCNFRIFRSDVASVFKSYVIMYGSVFFVWFIITIIIKYGMSSQLYEGKTSNQSFRDY